MDIMMPGDVHNLSLPIFVASCRVDKKENMKKIALVILACFSIGMTMNAVALEDYVGFSLDAVKSSENGVNNSSAGFTGMISARPDEYYGYEDKAASSVKSARMLQMPKLIFPWLAFCHWVIAASICMARLAWMVSIHLRMYTTVV